MAGDWIKIEKVLPHKPEVMQLADILDIDELHVVGHLILFWSWVDGQMSSDCPHVLGTKRGLDRAAGRTGFAAALVEVGWLEIDGLNITVPNMDYHLSKSAKTRARDLKNKQRRRNVPAERGHVSSPNEEIPGTREEKRREEKNPSIYIPGEGIKIPASVDTPEQIAAIGRWLAHLEIVAPDKRPQNNSPQEQALFATLGRWDSKAIEARIDECIGNGWLNLRPPESPRQSNGNGKPQGKGIMDHLDDMIEEEKRSEQF